jgi:hypothetical protein
MMLISCDGGERTTEGMVPGKDTRKKKEKAGRGLTIQRRKSQGWQKSMG